MKKNLLTLFALIVLCVYQSYSLNIIDYKIIINKKSWKTEKIIPLKHMDDKYLNDGKLYIHFQSSFEHDTVLIKKNGEIYGRYDLTTEWVLGCAKVVAIPDFDEIKTITISINSGKEAILDINKLNQIIITYEKKKLVIGYSKHMHYYE